MIAPSKAFENISFLNSSYCRPVRLQLEYLHPGSDDDRRRGQVYHCTVRQRTHPLAGETVADCKNPKLAELVTYYEEARKLANLVSTTCQTNHECEYVVITGGGGGIMEAGNRGASEADCKSISLNIELPFEQEANPYVSPV